MLYEMGQEARNPALFCFCFSAYQRNLRELLFLFPLILLIFADWLFSFRLIHLINN
jgi:hypothetical protein